MNKLALCLDTSTPVLTAALVEHDGRGLKVLATRVAAPPAVVSTLVPGLFDELLAEARRTLDDVGLLVAGVGPGLFTGTRVALATMKAVSYARGLPLLGAGSLEAMALAGARGRVMRAGDELAFDEPLESEPLAPVLDARKGEVYFAVHRFRRGALETLQPPCASPPDEARRLVGDAKPVGAGAPVLGLPANEPLHPGAAELAFLALSRERSPAFDLASVLALEPTYLRPPEAEVARKKREAAGG